MGGVTHRAMVKNIDRLRAMNGNTTVGSQNYVITARLQNIRKKNNNGFQLLEKNVKL